MALQALAKSDGETEGLFVVQDDLLDESVLMVLQGCLSYVQRLGWPAQSSIQDLPAVGQHKIWPVFGKVLESANELVGGFGRKLLQLALGFPGRAVFDFAKSIARKKPPQIVPLTGRFRLDRKSVV